MFTPKPNQGFNPEMGANMPPALSYSVHEAQLEGFDPGETPESLLILEERLARQSLIDICLSRAQESSSGYSAGYFVRVFEEQGLFGDPMRSYQEIDRFNRNQEISHKAIY